MEFYWRNHGVTSFIHRYVHENQLKIWFWLYFHFFIYHCNLQYNELKFC